MINSRHLLSFFLKISFTITRDFIFNMIQCWIHFRDKISVLTHQSGACIATCKCLWLVLVLILSFYRTCLLGIGWNLKASPSHRLQVSTEYFIICLWDFWSIYILFLSNNRAENEADCKKLGCFTYNIILRSWWLWADYVDLKHVTQHLVQLLISLNFSIFVKIVGYNVMINLIMY